MTHTDPGVELDMGSHIGTSKDNAFSQQVSASACVAPVACDVLCSFKENKKAAGSFYTVP